MGTQKDAVLLGAYLIVGDDQLKREAVLKRLRIRLEKLGDLSFNFDRFDGGTAEGESIVAACLTLPFASEKRLVQVDDVEKLKKADTEAIVNYLSDPSSSTVLALVAEKLAKNTRLYKAVAALGKQAVIDCTSPKAYELPKQVRNMAVTHGLTMTDRAAALLVELIGADTVHLDKELEKLALAHTGNTPLDRDDVERMVVRVDEPKPWEYVDALSARDAAKCALLAKRMPSTSPHALLGMCVSRIRELICAQTIVASGGGQTQLAQELKLPDWRVKNHIRWAKGYHRKELIEALEGAMETEKKMKSGIDPDAALFEWTMSVSARPTTDNH